MKDILEEILENKRAELVREKAALPPASLYAQVERQIGSEMEQQTNLRIDNHSLASSALKHRSIRRSLHDSATGIIALGKSDFIRLPLPAANTTAATFLFIKKQLLFS